MARQGQAWLGMARRGGAMQGKDILTVNKLNITNLKINEKLY
jgi:hypothetical protein